MYSYMLKFDKATSSLLLFKSILFQSLSNCLSESDVFTIFRIHKYSIHSVL